jgi:hypothetical protein
MDRWLNWVVGLAVAITVAAGVGHNDVPTSRPATGCVQVNMPIAD